MCFAYQKKEKEEEEQEEEKVISFEISDFEKAGKFDVDDSIEYFNHHDSRV